MKWVATAVLLLTAACQSIPIEEAQESRQVQSIVRTTNSPFCPGKTLDSCPSPRAAEWRQDINEWVGEGVSEEQIRSRLQERVPGFDLTPSPVKFGWLIPVVALILSTFWLVVVGRSFRGPSLPRRSHPPASKELDARLDEELAQLDYPDQKPRRA